MGLVILYGTQTGTAERVAFRIARLALKRGATGVRCLPADDVPVDTWLSDASKGDAFVFVCANANQGEAPNSFRRTWVSLLDSDAPALDGIAYAVFGLGDSLYPKFNYMAKMLHNRLRQLGGTPLLLRGLGDESDAHGLEEALLPWLTSLWVALRYIPEGHDDDRRLPAEDPLVAPLFPLYNIKMLSCPTISAEQFATAAVQPHGDAQKFFSSEALQEVPYAENTFGAEVTLNRRLTAEDHFQRVHHIELRLEPLGHTPAPSTYDVGDALGIYCRNRPELVEELIARLGFTGEEVLLVDADNTHGIVQQAARPFFGKPMTLRFLLQHYYDLDAVVSPDFLWMLAHLVESPSGAQGDEEALELRERLLELANPLHINEFLQYSHREKRNVCEVLHDFRTLRPSLELLLTFVARMQPRLFSISSAAAYDALPTVHLTVAQLEWTTPLKRHRTGLCSSQLISAAVGSRWPCFIWPGTLHSPPAPLPLLCIATGTGVAPVRALIRQCAGFSATHDHWKSVPIYLFFGCRMKRMDYLYASEWAELAENGRLPQLRVIPAFSRDTDKKVYVQHQLGAHAKLVGSLLEDACQTMIFVCGNSVQMPKDVQVTLDSIMEACVCCHDEVLAQQKMKQLMREGRYQTDTWSS